MSWYSRLTNVFRGARHAADLHAELRFHLDERVDELSASGLTPDEARHEARRRFGPMMTHRECTRDMDVVRAVDIASRDLRRGWRQLRLSPGFTIVAVVSLAFGIGATSAMFQLINALQMRALPVRDPAALVAVTRGPGFHASGWSVARNPSFTYAQVEQIARHQQAFSDLLAFGTTRFDLSTGGESRYVQGLYTTTNVLAVLGIEPFIGSGFTATADPRDCSGAGAMLNYTFWERQFARDPAVVGRTITLDGRAFPIVGVTPPGFFGLEPGYRFDVALPLCADSLFGLNRMDNREAWWLSPIGRLRVGWTFERAEAHVRGLSGVVFGASLPETYRPDAQREYLKNVLTAEQAEAGLSNMRQTYNEPLWIMLVTAGLVLLIACANLANLLLARATVREREIVLRLAIGASRERLVAQLMVESLLLAALGTAIGALLAQGLGRALVFFLDGGATPVHLPLGVDWRFFGFTAALGLAACLLFGLAPALRATRSTPAEVLRRGRGAASLDHGQRLRRALVLSQIALSFVLLVGALLFGQSLRNLLATDTGLDLEHVLVASVRTTQDPERREAEFSQLEERVRRLPDVASAASVFIAPFSGIRWNQDAYADGNPSDVELVWFNRVGPGYFDTLGIPVLAGRDVDAHDRRDAPEVAVVNEQFARALFGGGKPVGRTFRVQGDAGEEDRTYQIVGLVSDTKYAALRESALAIAYLPLAQETESRDMVNLVIRPRGAVPAVMAAVQQQMAAVNPRMLVEFGPLDRLARSLRRERLLASVSGGFGLLAVMLSTVGLYGVMAYMVSRRRNEIGLRLALGARRSNILRLVFAETGRLLLVGLAIGLAASLALSRYAESLLFGLAPRDAGIMALAGALLAATAIAAGLIPALRAATLDPAVTLRTE